MHLFLLCICAHGAFVPTVHSCILCICACPHIVHLCMSSYCTFSCCICTTVRMYSGSRSASLRLRSASMVVFLLVDKCLLPPRLQVEAVGLLVQALRVAPSFVSRARVIRLMSLVCMSLTCMHVQCDFADSTTTRICCSDMGMCRKMNGACLGAKCCLCFHGVGWKRAWLSNSNSVTISPRFCRIDTTTCVQSYFICVVVPDM